MIGKVPPTGAVRLALGRLGLVSAGQSGVTAGTGATWALAARTAGTYRDRPGQACGPTLAATAAADHGQGSAHGERSRMASVQPGWD
jgi:hypothetical protein